MRAPAHRASGASAGRGAGAGLGPHAALLAVQLMFGTWPIFGKIVLRSLPSTGLVAIRLAGAAVAFALLKRFLPHGTVRREHFPRLALYSLLGVFLNQLLFTKGLELSTAVNATLLASAIPVFTLLVSILMGHERATPLSWLGMALAAGGVATLVNPFAADFSGQHALGNLLIVANTVAYGAYIAVSQDMMRRYGALSVITYMFAFGSLYALPF
ncbi:MAG TPA: DMT family transporter, partial [Pyrinomonadaceae bacterium]|nr:DMT family transporter [Pyrinomonadaceae bacterium]